ncbi:MAG: phosphoribosylaminoimidazolesuccinocarboxamide synthase, partial [SAR324 cluster bacterium]|nr:phosphoribosylaminoimidazolesuccinocarboxamide synthase [SAR324 cluster bacterium]
MIHSYKVLKPYHFKLSDQSCIYDHTNIIKTTPYGRNETTPDSSRYWLQESYAERVAAQENPEGLDKEFLRLWVNERCDPYKDVIPEIPEDTLVEFAGRYIQLFET